MLSLPQDPNRKTGKLGLFQESKQHLTRLTAKIDSADLLEPLRSRLGSSTTQVDAKRPGDTSEVEEERLAHPL